MSTDLTEEQMRRALFGGDVTIPAAPAPEKPPEVVFVSPPQPLKSNKAKKSEKAFTPRLRVVLQVGNIFEGATEEYVHQADTLSTLLAEQEAVRMARKKFKYIEVVSVNPM